MALVLLKLGNFKIKHFELKTLGCSSFIVIDKINFDTTNHKLDYIASTFDIG
jgi:hypothetical protein